MIGQTWTGRWDRQGPAIRGQKGQADRGRQTGRHWRRLGIHLLWCYLTSVTIEPKGLRMTLEEKVAQALQELEPRLEELAEGHAELLDADAERGRVTLKLIGGRLN